MPIAIYARTALSGDIEKQLTSAQAYCTAHHLGEPLVYQDDGVPGTLPLEDRPAGRQIIEDAKAGRFDMLIVHDFARLGRSITALQGTIDELAELGVRVCSIVDQKDGQEAV